MLDRPNTVETKYRFFKMVGLLLEWIKNHPVNFVFTIFLGALLSLMVEYVSVYIANSWLLFLAPIINSMILVGLISYMYIKYMNKKNNVEKKMYFALFLLSLLISLYSFAVLLLGEQTKNSLLSIVLQSFGFFIMTLCVVDIVANKNVLGLKYGLKTVHDNIEFFLKTFLFLVIFQIVYLVLSGIVFSSFPSELKMNLLLIMTIIIKIITGYIIVIFITEKEKNEIAA